MKIQEDSNRVFIEDEQGKMKAEVTFPQLHDNVVNINHTYVDESMRGQQIAEKLIRTVADKLRRENRKAKVSCSYAVKWFDKNKDYEDVLSISKVLDE